MAGLGTRDSGLGKSKGKGKSRRGVSLLLPTSPESRVPSPARRHQHGYTLLEVIVAFALLALALTLLLGTLSGATRQVRWSADAGRAALHAQSLLDTLGVAQPLQPGSRSGEFDDGRYQWTLQVAPWTDPARVAAPVPVGGNRLYELQLIVSWGDGRGEQLRMRSLRLVQPGLEAGVP